MRAKQFVLRRLVFGNGNYKVRDIKEVLVIQVFGDAVLLPGPAAHRQREFETAVESTAVSKRVREINKDSNNR